MAWVKGIAEAYFAESNRAVEERLEEMPSLASMLPAA
jgi:hypothetical protein